MPDFFIYSHWCQRLLVTYELKGLWHLKRINHIFTTITHRAINDRYQPFTCQGCQL